MLERLCRHWARHVGDPEDEWVSYAPDILVLVRAMREPTESMLATTIDRTYDFSEAGVLTRARRDIWNSMIDAILAEEPK